MYTARRSLHDGYDPEFNWQREYLVRRAMSSAAAITPRVIRGARCVCPPTSIRAGGQSRQFGRFTLLALSKRAR